jgi:TolB-like protein/DNA-binding winged helix-turn-helix (wHTH) protein
VKASSPLPPTICFGVFELDPRAGELRKRGMKIRLQGQPIEILLMLLEQPGEIVTREELQRKLWPGDTFVEYEPGLNNAIKRLRAALDDDADTPHFIETLPRRGYRFIGSVNGSKQTPAKGTRANTRVGPILWVLVFGALAVLVIATVVVGLNVHGWRDRILARNPKPNIQAIAVLPFANLSGDPGQEYFTDGMTEALITELGKISRQRVISRQSITQYKGSKKPLQEIARELNVDAVLEGTVERSGDRVRVSVHLSQAYPERQLWANEYSRSIRDVMSIEDEIARAVVDETQTQLTKQRPTMNTHPIDPQARDDYLRGRYFANGGAKPNATEPNLWTAVDYYKKAIEKDPNYALAYVGLADAYFDLGIDFGGIPGHSGKETLALAKATVSRALELDPELGEAHVANAWGLLTDWNWAEAEKESRLAATLNPNHSRAHFMYSLYLSAVGRHSEAISQMNYAIELDPFNAEYKDALGWTACRAHQYDLAIQLFKIGGDNLGLAFVYIFKKMYPEAIAAAEEDVSKFGRDPIHISTLAMAYGLGGRRRDAQKLINELKTRTARHHYVPPIFFVHAYIGVNDLNQALAWTERAYDDHDQYLFWAKASPSVDALRSEPRFQAVLRRMNFPQ